MAKNQEHQKGSRKEKTYSHEEYLREFFPTRYSEIKAERQSAEEVGDELADVALSKIKEIISHSTKKQSHQ